MMPPAHETTTKKGRKGRSKCERANSQDRRKIRYREFKAWFKSHICKIIVKYWKKSQRILKPVLFNDILVLTRTGWNPAPLVWFDGARHSRQFGSLSLLSIEVAYLWCATRRRGRYCESVAEASFKASGLSC